MKIKKHIAYLLTLIFSGCIDEYSMPLPFNEPQLVVDAVVSSKENESFVTIGWTYPAQEGCSFDDGWGNIFPTPCPPDTSRLGPFLVNGRIVIQEAGGSRHEFDFQMHDRKSYKTIEMPSVTGTPGKKYSLDIEINYQSSVTHYVSETVMPVTPQITKIDYEIRKGDVGKNDNYVPLIYFTEPQDEENFYLFKLCGVFSYSDIEYCGNSRVWPYSIISDEFLPEAVAGLSIDDGATIAKYAEFYPLSYSGTKVKMYSITRETYEFYKALIAQFNNDGGTYSPSPATPPGNISNGAIGVFRALSESSAVVYY